MSVSHGRGVRVHVSPLGNAFMNDIASWIVEAASLAGHRAELVDDGRLPSADGSVQFVVAPHEFYLLGGYSNREIDDACRRSVPICTEQPGTRWFEMGASLARRSAIAVDINRHGVDALRGVGVDAMHLQLGGVPSMDRRGPAQAERPTDLLFLGGRTHHRSTRLAELAPLLWSHETDIRLFTFSRPVRDGVDGLVFGREKYDVLARSRILLNVHRDAGGDGYFEWARMVEAMANGCAVVTEPVVGSEPLVAGAHFVAGPDLAHLVEDLLVDPDRCRELGDRAAAAVLDDHPLTDGLAPILTAAGGLPRPPRRIIAPHHVGRLRRAQQIPLLPVFAPHRALRARIFEAHQGEIALQRRIDRAACALRHGSPDHRVRVETAAYAAADPEVSVIVTLHNYADVVGETFASVVSSEDVDFEIVVVDDHSTDDGRAVVSELLTAHPETPAVLIGRDSNGGLAAARNVAFAESRADKVMVLDADNLVYPTCLARLSRALDADPGAAMAYATLEEFGAETGIRSAMGWHVPWLCEANYIDAQAMVRRGAWEEVGGYADDLALFGWEDWNLWLSLADRGLHGVHVPQILGRYRRQAESMIATSNQFSDLMLEHLMRLHPSLPWPEGTP